MKTAIERTLEKVVRIPFSGCWIFMGALNETGYGIVGTGGRGQPNDRSHRITYRHFCGPIPDGMFVCHACDVPSCCNPDHLFLGTPKDNSRDMVNKGLPEAWKTGPILAEASYPAVIVARAVTDGQALDLVLHAGAEPGPQRLGFARLGQRAAVVRWSHRRDGGRACASRETRIRLPPYARRFIGGFPLIYCTHQTKLI